MNKQHTAPDNFAPKQGSLNLPKFDSWKYKAQSQSQCFFDNILYLLRISYN